MDEAALMGAMGLCVRARAAVFGEEGCLKAVAGQSCGVLLVDESASAATKEKYRRACVRAQTPMAFLPENLLYRATGRPGMAMAVNRGGLADKIVNLLSAKVPEAQPMKSANDCGGASVE